MQTPVSSYDRVRETVEAEIMNGAALAQVEELLDEAPLPDDERDALWLLAWSLEQRLDERDEVVLAAPALPMRPALLALPGGPG